MSISIAMWLVVERTLRYGSIYLENNDRELFRRKSLWFHLAVHNRAAYSPSMVSILVVLSRPKLKSQIGVASRGLDVFG